MELSYTTDAKDYLALLQHHLDRSVLGKRFATFAWIAIAALAWMSVILPFIKFGVIDLWFVLRTLLAVALTFGFPFLYRWYNEGVFGQLINDRSVQGIAGLTVLVATAEFIEQRTKVTTARAAWRDVSTIVSTPKHDFISLAPLVTAMIPASAFADPEARRAFQAQLNQWRVSAQPPEN